ncbi:nuclear transport factor 2 family protein [Mycobacterium malmoense]|uniref:Limonene-1,2-epoxide hydrolase n=1 Tax=Mycobacterium malmoense TaxID=1780 RepID=A0ABX3SY26_MYCMA|nr:nuclear transport factor 2 family protein [Mycobacterium malmoense]ORA84641.1 limonene-1,2-epoxide hydrolase [Mycobacterium malmoense]QZA15665.1 nuclear transport factor 2 family protein [Mycobacterium malmoense]UNB92479.1 nuclear transport factor 2 family protein [Mycobacterium malmoense]
MTDVSTIAVRDVVLGLWQALSRRDWDAVKTFLAEDCLYVDMPLPAAAARGPDDIVKRLKVGLQPLAGYENHDGLLLTNGSDVMYEHSETWTFPTGEQGVLRFVTVHQVVWQNGDAKIAVWKDYWDMNSLTGFAPPNYFESLAGADMSWVVDATGLV